MEYYKSLFVNKRISKSQILFGILFIILSCMWILIKKYEEKPVVAFDWFYSIIFFLNGIVNIIEGNGIAINKIFGDTYILINDKEIIYKPKITSGEIKLNWEKISEVIFKTSKIEVIDEGNHKTEFLFNKLDYESVREIKNIIIGIAQNKNIIIKE